MPINNIKNAAGVAYMKINNVTGRDTQGVKNIRREAPARAENRVQVRENNQQADRVELRTRQMVENAVARTREMPEVREEKIAEVRQRIQAGNYNVSNREIARAMVGSILNEVA